MENGEIDLIDLYNAFKKTPIYRIINNTFRLIIGNKIWFIAFILIGAAGGYYLKTQKSSVFKSEMLVESHEINNYVSENIITTLNTLIAQGNYAELEKSGFNKSLISKIKSIQFISSNIKIRNIEQNIFKLTLRSSKMDSLNNIENAIINYLNNSPYTAKLKKYNLEKYYSEKKELFNQISELNGMSTLIKKQLTSGQPLTYTANPTIFNEKLIAKLRIMELDRMIQHIDNFYVLNPFTPAKTPEPIKGKEPIKYAFISFILGFIILGIFKRLGYFFS